MHRRKQNSRLAIGISTVRRAGLPDSPGYLNRTVNSLLARMSAAERSCMEIILVNSNWPPEDHTEVDLILSRHAEHVPHLLRPVAKGVPSFQPSDVSDRARIVAWERKLTCDFVHALRICPRHTQ